MIFGVCVSPMSAGKPRRPEKKARLLVSFGADDMTTFPDITSVVQGARQTSDKSRLKIQARRPAQPSVPGPGQQPAKRSSAIQFCAVCRNPSFEYLSSVPSLFRLETVSFALCIPCESRCSLVNYFEYPQAT